MCPSIQRTASPVRTRMPNDESSDNQDNSSNGSSPDQRAAHDRFAPYNLQHSSTEMPTSQPSTNDSKDIFGSNELNPNSC
jgi:hypothetical protein